MDSPSAKGVAITTTPNDAYEEMQQGKGKEEEEETPQYEVMCGPTASSPVTQHSLPVAPSPLDAPI